MNLADFFLGAASVFTGLKTFKAGVNTALSSLDLSDNKEPKSTVYNVSGSINQRIKHIKDLIKKGRQNPKIREYTVKLLARKCGKEWCVPEKDWRSEVEVIFNHVREKVRYTKDVADLDTFQAPNRTLEWGGGDCDCYTILLGSMLQSVGYPVIVRIIQTKNADSWSHIFLFVGLPPQAPSKWLPLDASVSKPAGWMAPKEIVKKSMDFKI